MSDALLVLSDRLIVKAQFDETDIGRVKAGQRAIITLDAYLNDKIEGVVDHIAYESELVNNVTIYDVDILPQEVPDFFRSGMSANVEVIQNEQKGALLIPVDAIQSEDDKKFVLVKRRRGGGVEKREIEVGLTGIADAEVISGLTTADTVIIRGQKYSPVKSQGSGANPFMPSRKK
jgi:macrolide-specific efflux system membrane fusion protein